LTLIPSLISCWMAGSPSAVAGTLMKTLGRFSAAHNRRASSIVPLVSCASSVVRQVRIDLQADISIFAISLVV